MAMPTLQTQTWTLMLFLTETECSALGFDHSFAPITSMHASCKLVADAKSSSESLNAFLIAALPASSSAPLRNASSMDVAAVGSAPTSSPHRFAQASMLSTTAATGEAATEASEALEEEDAYAAESLPGAGLGWRMRATTIGPADSAGLLANRLNDSPMLFMGDIARTNSAVIVLALLVPVMCA